MYLRRNVASNVSTIGLRNINNKSQQLKKRMTQLEQIIRECLESQNPVLDLSYQHLYNETYPELKLLEECTHLTSLNLTENNGIDLSFLPFLTNLTHLNLDGTYPSDFSILQSLTNLTHLNLSQYEYGFYNEEGCDISALQYLTNLISLNLDTVSITDISPLQYLTNLRDLNLQNDLLSDIFPLQYLTNLTTLNLGSSQLLDISALQYLTNLTNLVLSGDLLSDISALQYLTNLTNLILSGEQISDISALQYLTNLKDLNLQSEEVSDTFALQYLINLINLNLGNTRISGISALQYLTNLTSLNLNLWNSQVSDIEPFKYLTNLKNLDLRGLQISDISALQYLTNLTSLNLLGDQLSDISVLQYLTNLTSLNLGRSQLSDISALQYLTNLISLNLGSGKVSDISPLQYLTNLTSLNLGGGKVSDISPLQYLTNLTRLGLERNQISDISLLWLNSFTKLHSLSLSGNPIKNIPQEIFADFGNIHKMRDFLGDLEKYEGIENKEIKVIFVGNGNVGKTQIAKRLVEKENFVFDSQHNSTHAIVMLRRKLGNFQLNCWDFAGQDLYHATHKLFMQTNALFVLVWDFENENRDFHEWHNTKYENEKLNYWLEYARYFAPKSPILVLQNKIDVFSDDFSVEQKETLKNQYFILNFLGVSAKTNQGFEELENNLLTIFSENPSFQTPDLPTNWVEVREEMLKLQSNYTKTIEFSEFETICQSKGTQKSASTILGYLHDTGVVYHKSHYFNNKIIINQSWVIEAIYKVLDRESPEFDVLKAQKGLFLYENISKIWRNYPEEDQKVFMDFMLSAELAFATKKAHSNNFSDRTFIIPQFLPADKPDEVLAWEWEKENALVLQNKRKTHSFLPKGLIYGFMAYVSYLQELEEIIFMWQKGIFFKMKTGEVLVELFEDKQSKTISIKSRTNALIEQITKDLRYF